MNNTNSVIYYVILFIVSMLVTWVILSLLLMWASPSLYNPNGSVNWWTTLWVSVLLVIFVWIVFVIIHFIYRAIAGNKNAGCAKPECPKPKPKCEDPCATNYYAADSWSF